MTTDDDAIRDLIRRARADRMVPRDDLVFDLARVAETLLAERDQAKRDWYASNRLVHRLQGELARVLDEAKD